MQPVAKRWKGLVDSDTWQSGYLREGSAPFEKSTSGSANSLSLLRGSSGQNGPGDHYFPEVVTTAQASFRTNRSMRSSACSSSGNAVA